MITRTRLAEIESLARGHAVAVIGDLVLDEYLAGSVERISPEAPVPVLTYHSHRYALGGAGNAARTLAELGAAARLVGIVGADQAGQVFLEHVAEAGLDPAGIVVAAGRTTTLKTRVIAHTQQVVRIDREASGGLGPTVRGRLKSAAAAALEGADAVLVSDYDKGALSATSAREVVESARRLGIPVVVDSKASHPGYRNATVLTPNVGELERHTRVRIARDRDLSRAAAALMRRMAPEALLVTRAEAGMSLFGSGGDRVDIPALATEVHDVTGAGDTVAAVIALSLAAGLGLLEAAQLATLAAAVVVRKVGTAAPSFDEMTALASG